MDSKTPPRVHSKTSPPVYTGNTRTCVSTCARGAGTHGDVLFVHTGRSEWTHGGQKVIVSSAYQNLPTYGHHLLQRFTKETSGSFPFSSFLRIEREQHVPDSSIHSLYLIKRSVSALLTDTAEEISCDMVRFVFLHQIKFHERFAQWFHVFANISFHCIHI